MTTTHADHVPHTVHTYGEASSHRFRQRVLNARIAAYEAQAAELLEQLSACYRMGLLEEADVVEATLTERSREVLRLKAELNTTTAIVHLFAPQLALAI